MIHKVNVLHEQPTERARRKREVRTEAVLDAALAVLAAEGLDGLTLGAVAGRLGVVPAALYRYFPSKEALLAALQRRTLAVLGERLRAALVERGPRVERRLRDPGRRALAHLLLFAAFYLEAARALPEHLQLVRSFLADPRLLVSEAEAARTEPLLRALLGQVGAAFARAGDAGALEPGDVVSRTLALWSTVEGALLVGKLGRLDPELVRPDRLAELTVHALLRGFGARPADLAAAARAVADVQAEPAPS